jgi:hypothetical protein
MEPDPELADAADRLEGAFVNCYVPLTEAAAAWRAGRNALARRLAERAADRWRALGFVPGERMCRGLALVAGASPARGEPESLLRGLGALSLPASAAQVAGLVAMARPALRARARASLGSRPLPDARGGRWEVLHRDEVAIALGLGGAEADSSLSTIHKNVVTDLGPFS